MSVKATASIRLKFSDPKHLTAMVRALKPEITSSINHRTNVDLQACDGFLVLVINAKDPVALRAMVNAYMRWIASTVNVIDVIEHV
jgi:tRNA threonylcarbamoyladenosine modification (KEOPS) complex  Pcc1 subunit